MSAYSGCRGSSPPPSSCARLRGRVLLMTAAIVGPIRTETTATTVTAPTAMHAKPVLIAITLVAITLVAITLVVTVLPGVLLWLTAAGYECRQATYILSAFVCRLGSDVSGCG